MSEPVYCVNYTLTFEKGEWLSDIILPFPHNNVSDISVYQAVRKLEPRFDQAQYIEVSIWPYPRSEIPSYPTAELDRQGVIDVCLLLDKDKTVT